MNAGVFPAFFFVWKGRSVSIHTKKSSEFVENEKISKKETKIFEKGIYKIDFMW